MRTEYYDFYIEEQISEDTWGCAIFCQEQGHNIITAKFCSGDNGYYVTDIVLIDTYAQTEENMNLAQGMFRKCIDDVEEWLSQDASNEVVEYSDNVIPAVNAPLIFKDGSIDELKPYPGKETE